MPQLNPPLWPRPAATALALALGLAIAGCNGGDPEALIADARAYRQKGEINAAVIQLKNALQKKPDHRTARVLLAEVYLEHGDPVSAEKELRRALALGATAAELNPLLGKSMLMQGQYERVLDEIKGATDAGQRASLLALRGNALLGLRKSEQAGELFNEALKYSPSFGEALLGLSRIALAERRPADAAAMLARALAANPGDIDCLRFKGDLLRAEGKPEPALEAYRKILALRPNNAQAHIDVANIFIDAAKFKDARAEIQAARKASPATLAVLYAQALLDFRESKHAAAQESLQQILRTVPEHFPSLLLLGAVQAALGSNQQAEQNLRKFLAAYPRHLYASKLLASLNLRANNPDAALGLLRPLLIAHEGDVELLTLAGEANMRARNFSRAADYFEQASALQPNASMLHTALALSRLGTGENARAVAELERAASLDIKSSRTGVLLVMSYLRANAPDKALAAIADMEKQGNNPLVQNLKGGVHLARQDIKSARACFDNALALDPLYMPALDNLAQLDALEKRPADAKQRYLAALAKAPKNAALMEALARLATAQGNTPQAVGWLEKASKENPEALGLALRLADFYSRSGDKQKAMVLAQKLQAGNPSNPDALALLAQVYYTNQNFNAAADSYSRLAALVPGSAAPHMKLATAQLAMREPAAAIASLRKALAIEPDLLDAHLALLDVLVDQKRFPEAMTLAASVQKRHPESPAGYQLEGDVFSAQDKPAPALKAYERAFSLGQGGPLLLRIHSALSKLGRAVEADARLSLWLKQHPADVATRLYFASSKVVRNDYPAAIEQLEAVLKHEPKNIIALNDLAWAYQHVNDKHALAYAERAYQLAPNSPAIMDTLGWIRLESGDLARALPLLRKASALAPNAGEIGYHFGMVLARSGDKRGARRELERVLALPAAFAKREEAKALLATL
jgi:putative PEP-CTERM system TPR-repeat lipoprotein